MKMHLYTYSDLIQSNSQRGHTQQTFAAAAVAARPVVNRPTSPLSYWEDRTTAAIFKGPITHSIESTVTNSASAAIVDSVTWPDLRSPCYAIAGNYQVIRLKFKLQ